MSLESGEIIFWDGYQNVRYLIAQNFEEFICKLYNDELSPRLDTPD